MVQSKKLHEAAHAHLQTEFLADLHGTLISDTGDFRKPLRLPLHNLQGLSAKPIYNSLGDLGADALDHTAGQIGENLHFRLGHHPLQKLRFELFAVAGMRGPLAGYHQPLAQAGQGNGANDGNMLIFADIHAQHAVAVVIVLIDNGGDGAL